ncbi:endogenous retrovirus group 3 member 1 Env polyprotein-like [Rhineura floridana]|uniref:endogenous retrovirus group 3 member 1 Env polyprotein-like n=1 Tax=Rhineura floridana TaxID=261503 RepID=UPI002AC81153|nr:endogenous retrovirus group 3 member 1 Env polyprotein-like [Rhineura floridana]
MASLPLCRICIKTVRNHNNIQDTIDYQSKFSCKGTTVACQFRNVSYSACTQGNQTTCYDPKENPDHWWLQVREGTQSGRVLSQIRLATPNTKAWIKIEPCEISKWPDQCGGYDWEKTYTWNDKYICPEKGISTECTNQCPYWNCVGWATWQTTGINAHLSKVTVRSDCGPRKCNYVNFTINNPQAFLSKFGQHFGLRIHGRGKDPLGLFYLKLVQLTQAGHTLQQTFFSEFWEEIKTPFQVPEVARNLFITFAETVATTLNISNCYVCGGTQIGDHWPWEAAELDVSQPYNTTNVSNPHSQWILKATLVGRWCVQRISPRAPQIGQMPCETMTILNQSTVSYWPNVSMIPVNLLWTLELKLRLNLSVVNNNSWKALPGFYWVCGKYAYSKLPEPWEGTCTLGEVRPSFFLIPLSAGVRLGHPVYDRKKRMTIKIGDWKDDEWPPERIVQYYGPATWAQDGSYGYRTPIYMLNRIIRLQAVLELITNETARALTVLSKTQTQLRNAVYQNRLALDYLLAAEGGVCGKFNLTNCCLHIDDNGKVIEDITDKIIKLAHVPVQTWKGFEWAKGLGPWFQWVGGIRGIIGIIIVGILMCVLLPCILPLIMQGLRNMMENIADRRTAVQLMALYEYRSKATCENDTP